MQKIMFNDRYGLTQAVIEGRKTMTRRIELRGSEQNIIIPGGLEATSRSLKVRQNGQLIMSVPFRYKLGEVVAVAQSYEAAGFDPEYYIEGGLYAKKHAGWRNKMFVSAQYMPHQIRITGIRCERLQDISDEDCMKEGIRFIPEINKFYFEDVRQEEGFYRGTPREAFADLIDRVSGKGTWERNPWVVVYEFDLVK